MPEDVLLLLRQIVVRSKNREVVFCYTTDELLFPFTHFLSSPAHHGSVIDAQFLIRDDQMLVDAHDFAESLTFGTSASRRIEREELVGWFLETHAVRLELHGKLMHLGLLQFEYTRRIHEFQHTGFVALVERRASGIHQSVHRLLVVSHHQAVNHQKDLRIVRNGRIQRQIL